MKHTSATPVDEQISWSGNGGVPSLAPSGSQRLVKYAFSGAGVIWLTALETKNSLGDSSSTTSLD